MIKLPDIMSNMRTQKDGVKKQALNITESLQ